MARKTRTRPTSSSPDDPATAYARSVVSGETVAGPYVRDACARHLRDLVEGPARGLRWEPEAAKRFAEFCRVVCCVQVADQWLPFALHPSQHFIAGSLFGWKRSDGKRRFRTAYVEQGKGNGKSPLAAAIGHYMLVADGELSAEVYAAASKKDQAMILFRDAVAMWQNSPALRSRLTPSGGNPVWNLAHIASGSFFRPISAESGQSGPRPHGALVDELHEHRDGAVLRMLKAGQKARSQPLTFIITNSGHDRRSACYDEHQYGIEVAAGTKEDDEYFAYICALDEGDDWREDESCWIKTNPLLGVTIKVEYLRKQVREAVGIPAYANTVARLNFCIWTDSDTAAISRAVWDACQADVDCDALTEAGHPCYGGLDLSRTGDLTAFTLTWLLDASRDRQRFASKTWFWTPRSTLRDRSLRDRAPYELWVEQGFMEAVPGPRVSYRWVADALGSLCARYNPVSIGGDPYGMGQLLEQLNDIGLSLPIETHPQGFNRRVVSKDEDGPDGANEVALWMPDSINKVEAALLEERIQIDRSPVMTMCAASVVYEQNRTGHRMFSKDKATNRIDGMVSLAMSIGMATLAPQTSGPSVFELIAAQRRAQAAEAPA